MAKKKFKAWVPSEIWLSGITHDIMFKRPRYPKKWVRYVLAKSEPGEAKDE